MFSSISQSILIASLLPIHEIFQKTNKTLLHMKSWVLLSINNFWKAAFSLEIDVYNNVFHPMTVTFLCTECRPVWIVHLHCPIQYDPIQDVWHRWIATLVVISHIQCYAVLIHCMWQYRKDELDRPINWLWVSLHTHMCTHFYGTEHHYIAETQFLSKKYLPGPFFFWSLVLACPQNRSPYRNWN